MGAGGRAPSTTSLPGGNQNRCSPSVGRDPHSPARPRASLWHVEGGGAERGEHTGLRVVTAPGRSSDLSAPGSELEVPAWLSVHKSCCHLGHLPLSSPDTHIHSQAPVPSPAVAVASLPSQFPAPSSTTPTTLIPSSLDFLLKSTAQSHPPAGTRPLHTGARSSSGPPRGCLRVRMQQRC